MYQLLQDQGQGSFNCTSRDKYGVRKQKAGDRVNQKKNKLWSKSALYNTTTFQISEDQRFWQGEFKCTSHLKLLE